MNGCVLAPHFISNKLFMMIFFSSEVNNFYIYTHTHIYTLIYFEVCNTNQFILELMFMIVVEQLFILKVFFNEKLIIFYNLLTFAIFVDIWGLLFGTPTHSQCSLLFSSS